MKALNGIRTLDLCDTSAVLYHFCSFTQKDAILLQSAIFHGLTQTAFGKWKDTLSSKYPEMLTFKVAYNSFLSFWDFRTRCDFHFLR